MENPMSDFTVPEHLPDWISSHVRLYLGSGGKECDPKSGEQDVAGRHLETILALASP